MVNKTYSTNKWYYIEPFWCKFISKTEGWTACGKNLKIVNGKVTIPTEILNLDNNDIEIFYKQID